MFSVFYLGVNFCVQGRFSSRNSFFGEVVKTFYLREKCLYKGFKYHLWESNFLNFNSYFNVIFLICEKFFPRKCLPLKQFCSDLDIPYFHERSIHNQLDIVIRFKADSLISSQCNCFRIRANSCTSNFHLGPEGSANPIHRLCNAMQAIIT